MCEGGAIPLFLGGDHSIAMGTIAGVAAHWREQGKRLGLIWFDAHGDFNTPDTTVSGNIHGMPLAATMGFGHEAFTMLGGFAPKIDPRDAVLIGVRNLDSKEKEALRHGGFTVFTMRDIDELGIKEVMARATAIACRNTDALHVSLDIDVVDPEVAPGVGTPSLGGPSYREIHLAMELLADSKQVTSMDLVEINPAFDLRNNTAQLGVELVCSALGARIL